MDGQKLGGEDNRSTLVCHIIPFWCLRIAHGDKRRCRSGSKPFLESVPEVAAQLKEPNTKDRKFEAVVKSAEQAAVLVLVY